MTKIENPRPAGEAEGEGHAELGNIVPSSTDEVKANLAESVAESVATSPECDDQGAFATIETIENEPEAPPAATESAPRPRYTALRFFQTLFLACANSLISIFTLPDRQTAWFPTNRAGLVMAVAYANRKAREGQNVYYGVCSHNPDAIQTLPAGSRGTRATVSAVPCVWADIDFSNGTHKAGKLYPSRQQAMEFIINLPLLPSVIVESGGGYHCNWIFPAPEIISSEADRDRLEAVSRAFQLRLLAMLQQVDPALEMDEVGDLPRILRVPGTKNFKGAEPLPVTIIEADYDRQYTLAQIVEAFALDANPVSSRSARASAPTNCRTMPLQPDLQGAASVLQGAPAGERNSRLFKYACQLVGRGLSRDEMVALLEVAAGNCDPPYPSDAGDESIEHMVDRVILTYQRPGQVDTAEFFDGRRFIPRRVGEAILNDSRLAIAVDAEGRKGQIRIYLNGVWQQAHDLKADIHRRLGEESTRRRVEEVEFALEQEVPRVPMVEWNREIYRVNCLSGMVDVVSGAVLPHDPTYYSSIQVPHEYDPAATCELFDTVLEELLGTDGAAQFLAMIGYLLVPILDADRFFILGGTSNAGKTTLFEVVLALIGLDNFVLVTPHQLSDDKFALARLENKLLACYDDVGALPLRSASQLKALTGGVPYISVERKFKDSYRAPLVARLLFTANDVPPVQDPSAAFYRRPLFFRMNTLDPAKLSAGKLDPDLVHKLTTPASMRGIFRKAVEALRDLMANDFRFPESEGHREMLVAYKRRCDPILTFIEEQCERGPEFRIQRQTLYRAYRAMMNDLDLSTVSQQAFYDSLERLGLSQRKVTGVRYLVGLKLRHECDVDLKRRIPFWTTAGETD